MLSALLVALCPLIQDDPEPLPVRIDAVATPLADDGTFDLCLACTPTGDLAGNFDLRVVVSCGGVDLVVRDLELSPRTSRWEVGRSTQHRFELELPADAELEPGDRCEVRLGLLSDRGRVHPPLIDPVWIGLDGLSEVDSFELPPYALAAGQARLEAVLAEAEDLRRAERAPEAWTLLDGALRGCADEAGKQRVRRALTEVGGFPPAPQSEHEQEIVARRIRAEQVRVFRLEAGRMHASGQLHGALRLLEEVGGALSVDVDEKVIGAVNDVQRTTRDIDEVRAELLSGLDEGDGARLAELVEEHGRTQDLFDTAEELAAAARYPLALALYRKLRRVDGLELYDRAQSRLEEVGELYLAATPPDQAAAVRAVLEHPAWARTTVVASHAFLFIGPRELVEGIPARSKLRFDLAYVFQTDLFGRRPNPRGDRLTVYFKELWDFGGGVGGGKQIDIGRAHYSPPKPVPVDTGLLYHELCHCVDDTLPIHEGFREGLANLGAAFTHEVLAHPGDDLHSFEGNLESFRTFFLNRDLEYWRIQNYGPSAGFFLHFVDAYARGANGRHDWSGLRRFFREYRDAPLRDGREHEVVRSLGRHLTRAFGPQVFDDLVRFGFPLEESDRHLLAEEQAAFAGADVASFEERYAECPNSPLPRDLVERRLLENSEWGELERCAELRAELGIVSDWKLIGPFFAERADPGACVFPPEREIDFAAKPTTWRASRADHTTRFWQDPQPSWVPTDSHKDVELYPNGWLRFDYQPYGDDNSAIYALTHVTVPAAVDAVAHLRADDDVVLFLNDRRIGSYRGRGANGSNTRWRGPRAPAPDGLRLPLRLEAGRNQLLVKVRNRYGPAGLVLALSRPDGSTLDFTADARPPDSPGPRVPVAEPRWKSLVSLEHRSYKSRTRVEVGSFSVRNKLIFGGSTGGQVGWRLFTVRPGFPKDSPSNLLWLKANLTEDLEALRIDVELDGDAAPKLLLTFQGEGDRDGLSGWNLILVPAGDRRISARLERYDRLVYESDPIELPEVDGSRLLSLRTWDGWCSASIDGLDLFERVSIRPIPGRHRVGLATWGPEPRIRSLELFRGR